MTNEKMLSYANELKKMIENNASELASYSYVEKIINELEADIRKAEAKKTNKTDIFKTCNAIIKYAKKERPNMIALHGAWVDENNNQYVTDSYRLIRMKNNIPLETIPENCTPMKVDSIFSTKYKYKHEIEMPSINELKEFIKIEKAKGIKTPKYDLGENRPLVNAKFLLDIMTGDNFKYYIIKDNLNMIYFVNADETIDGFICCIRK